MCFDNRIAVVLGCVALMLASVPVLTRHSASSAVTAPPLPNASSQVSTVADKPASTRVAVVNVESAGAATPKLAAAGKIATARVTVANVESVRAASPNLTATGNIATARAVVASTPLPRARPKGVAAVKVASVPLPRARPQRVNVAGLSLPKARPQTITIVQVPLPKERPQRITIAQVPLPKARPQSIAVAETVPPNQPTRVADAASNSSARGDTANPPLPKARPQSIAAAKMPLPGRPTLLADASSKPSPSGAETNPPGAGASLQSIAADKMPPPGEPAPVADPFSDESLSGVEIDPPPLPKARPDRMILVAEARRYMGTNPTDRSRLWCAAFMNLILHKIGYDGTHSDAARSFVDYGRRIPGPKIGAIVVFSRGPNGGHVGVVAGVDRHGNPIVISGNHGHRVGKGVYPRSRVLAYVLPTRRVARHAQSARRPQHLSAATTQLTARSAYARADAAAAADSPIVELLASIAAEYGGGRPASAALRARSTRGRPSNSLLFKFFGSKG
jgi:uncharacterized protein (TIGR02594 family)